MLVSIGIPSYNHAEFLPEAIESCLNQTYKDIEIIIVDDGSSDNSLEIARQYEQLHPSVISVFTHPENRHLGISAAVNLAFSKSQGEFYSGLASDDVLYPEKTEKQVNYLLNHSDVGWVYSKAQWFGAMSKIVSIDISQDPDPLETLIIRNRIWGITVLARRDVWDRTGPHDETLVISDWDFWVRMLKVSQVGFMDEVLAGARIHSGNTSVGISLKEACEYSVEVMTAMRAQHFEPKHLGLINLKLSENLFELGRLAEARERLGDAFDVSDDAASYLAYFARLTSAEYRRWALPILPSVSAITREGPYIKAEPNPVYGGDELLGKTLISWSTSDTATKQVDVYVHNPAAGESLFASGANGSKEAPWIEFGLPAEFRLYSVEESMRSLLDRVVVTRQSLEPNALPGDLSLAERDHRVQELLAQLTAKDVIVEEYLKQIAKEIENARLLSSQLAEKDKIVQMLSEEIAEQELVGQSRAEYDAERIAELSAQLLDTQTQLKRIRETLGWRLLSQYGRIKYRYLLPAYQRFRPDPTETGSRSTDD